MADDVISLAHTGHQLPVPALPVGGAQIHAGPAALHTQKVSYSLQLQHGCPQFLHRQRGQCYSNTTYMTICKEISAGLMSFQFCQSSVEAALLVLHI